MRPTGSNKRPSGGSRAGFEKLHPRAGNGTFAVKRAKDPRSPQMPTLPTRPPAAAGATTNRQPQTLVRTVVAGQAIELLRFDGQWQANTAPPPTDGGFEHRRRCTERALLGAAMARTLDAGLVSHDDVAALSAHLDALMGDRRRDHATGQADPESVETAARHALEQIRADISVEQSGDAGERLVDEAFYSQPAPLPKRSARWLRRGDRQTERPIDAARRRVLFPLYGPQDLQP